MTETYFAHAYEKGVDSQPRKTNIVASLVRDRYVADAVVILEHTPRRAARAVLKAVESANANLLNNSKVSIDPKTIRIARIFVTSGTRMRRYKPASRGRALPYEKISSNIFVEVAGEEKVKKATSEDKKTAEKLKTIEAQLDDYEDKIGSYLVKVSACELSEADGQEVNKLLHSIGDFERIGDNAVSIERVLSQMQDKEKTFSAASMHELQVLSTAVMDIMNMTVEVFNTNDVELAAKIEPLEQVIDGLAAKIKKRHIKRLKTGECTVERGIDLSDILTNMKRISDYCSNVAVCVIQIAHATFETHSYLRKIRYTNQPEFISDFEDYKDKYNINEN